MEKTILYRKNILLCVGGGIAAYKAVVLLRELIKLGANVQVVMTKNATQFIGSITFEALSSNSVFFNLFKDKNDKGIPHIELAESSDAVILAPATANIISKIANGLADDLLTTLMLAVTCPVMICPSMNSNMYEHPATQRNLNRLKLYDYFVLSAEDGELACGITGSGRLPEPSKIIDRLISYLTPNDMEGKRVLITAGPTQEFIDPVRYISNPSSGKMGYAIARAAENRGANVTLISGPVFIKAPLNINIIAVKSASDMADAVFKDLDTFDIVIKVAAVSDYSPEKFVYNKIKKDKSYTNLKLNKTLDILANIGHISRKDQVIVGFAAETCNLILNAKKKLKKKKLDLLVANLISPINPGFSSDTNSVTLFFSNGVVEEIDIMSKDSLAHLLLDRIVTIFISKHNFL